MQYFCNFFIKKLRKINFPNFLIYHFIPFIYFGCTHVLECDIFAIFQSIHDFFFFNFKLKTVFSQLTFFFFEGIIKTPVFINFVLLVYRMGQGPSADKTSFESKTQRPNTNSCPRPNFPNFASNLFTTFNIKFFNFIIPMDFG